MSWQLWPFIFHHMTSQNITITVGSSHLGHSDRLDQSYNSEFGQWQCMALQNQLLYSEYAPLQVWPMSNSTVGHTDHGCIQERKCGFVICLRLSQYSLAIINRLSFAYVWMQTGVLMWEVFTCGEMPYSGMKNPDVVENVCNRNYRLSQTDHCPDAVYEIMCSCWHQVSFWGSK